MSARVRCAVRRAKAGDRPDREAAPRRFYAIGDPQTSCERVFTVLDRHALLDDEGFLAPDVGLVSMGDHFDFGDDPEHAAEEGIALLRWLSGHPQHQAPILLGNHDAARVTELADLDDDAFSEARRLANAVHAGIEPEARFRERFPALPAPGLARVDFSAYTVAQRALVQELLLGGRVRLGLLGRAIGGHDVLLTHAGVTVRDLDVLGVPPVAREVARALEDLLAVRVEAVRAAWERGEAARLDLSPLHVAGDGTGEGGGMLYQRPARPDSRIRERADTVWEFDPERPRRYDPRTLPAGLAQACGHTSHRRCLRELPGWYGPEADRAPPGAVRTLSVLGGEVSYAPGMGSPVPGGASIWLVDGDMHRVDPADYELLPLAGWGP